MRIVGLPDDLQALVDSLIEVINKKSVRNEIRQRFMDHKEVIAKYGLLEMAPDNLKVVIGWPAKAVNALARRCNLEGFASTGGDLDAYGIDDLLESNQFLREAPQGHVASLVNSCAFQVATLGDTDAGEPPALITRVTALNGTGEWNPRVRHLVSFLSIIRRDQLSVPVDMNLYLPDRTYTIVGRRVVNVAAQPLGRVPVEVLPYQPQLGRPFGTSRISRPVISLTHSAMRGIVRSESTADLYSAPGLIAFGLTSDQLKSGAWIQGIGNVVGIPDADADQAPSDALARAQVQVVQQASQEPHIAQLRAWAQLFAGETNIPVSSLGLSIDQANPTSAEAYAASREDLIAEAEGAIREWGAAHTKTLQMAWALREQVSLDALPDAIRMIRPRWRDPRYVSQAAAADAFTKLASVIPELAQTDAALDMLGLDDSLVQRLKADLRRVRARASIAALTQPSDAVTG